MDPKRRNLVIYGVLLAVWALVVAWQIQEHNRAKEVARAGLLGRSKDVANLVGAFIRGARFRGAVFPETLERVLGEIVNTKTNELLRASEVLWLAVLNADGDPLAAAGTPTIDSHQELPEAGLWEHDRMTKEYVVAGMPQETNQIPTVVTLPFREMTNNPPEPGRGRGRREPRPDGPPPDDRPGGPPGGPRPEGAGVEPWRDRSEPTGTNVSVAGMRPRDDPRPPRRPFWARGMDEAAYQSFIKRRELHGLLVTMSTKSVETFGLQDLWLRCIIVFFASISAVGVAVAWRNLAKTSDLQLRLVRTSELNIHLKEMNLAAAGLAHETRNPLNIIRGLAHMISRQPDAAPETRARSREIVDETDKVTAQLNEFINYSRPREVRRSAVALNSIIGEVTRALSHDIEEKKIHVETKGERLLIEADEQLFRQVLFNLVLNAAQAVGENGEIQILTQRTGASEAILEVRDNGPGVPPERRAEIFKPYFTTNAKGTGLGLAIVHQNVQAHGWEIQVLPNEPKGAIFRLSHLKVART